MAEGFRVYTDDVNKFKILIPQGEEGKMESYNLLFQVVLKVLFLQSGKWVLGNRMDLNP